MGKKKEQPYEGLSNVERKKWLLETVVKLDSFVHKLTAKPKEIEDLKKRVAALEKAIKQK